MPNKQIEKQIEDDFVDYAYTCYCDAHKLIDKEDSGFPDRTIFCPSGYVFFIEFKKPKEAPNPKQRLIMKYLKSQGFNVYACDDLSEAKEILNCELKGLLDVRY